jgi:hypothetical protein
MLKTLWWTGHKGLQLQLPSAQWSTNTSLVISVLLMEETSQWGLKLYNDLQN